MLFPYFMAIKTLGNEGPIFVSLIFDVFSRSCPLNAPLMNYISFEHSLTVLYDLLVTNGTSEGQLFYLDRKKRHFANGSIERNQLHCAIGCLHDAQVANQLIVYITGSCLADWYEFPDIVIIQPKFDIYGKILFGGSLM